MLSRANSDAGIRLRRAKSSSSVYHPSHATSSPVVDARHAELAAVEAYRRAYKANDPFYQPRSSVKPHTRRNQTSQKSEGSHFEESRNRNRIGTARPKGPSRSTSAKRSQSRVKPDNNTPSAEYEERIITRSRRVVDNTAGSSLGLDHSSTYESGNSDHHRVCKAKSAFYEPLSAQNDPFDFRKARRATCYPDTPYRTAIEDREPERSDPPAILPLTISRKPTPREMQTDENVKVAAWDAYLQDFHQRKVHVRKSFIAPIKKRLTRDVTTVDEAPFDNSVPPYNFAAESDDVFSSSSIPPVQTTESLQITKLRKTRTVSDSLKNKFQRLIGKTKRMQSSIPVQHVESQYRTFDTNASIDHTGSVASKYTLSLPPPLPASSPPGTVRTRKSSSRSSHSNGDAATTRSRVTSWTNSVGTNRGSGQGIRLSSINETGMAVESVGEPAIETKQGHGSFLGRALRLPLRRQSKSDINRSSEESQRLYDALRKQIQQPEEYTEATLEETTISDDVVATDTMVKEYLPPRCRDDQQLDELLVAPTIRTVEPEPQMTALAAPNSAKPPSIPPPEPPKQETRKSPWMQNARRSLPSQTSLHRDKGGGPKVIIPSQEQIAARLDKSKNRWQSALEDHSPVQSRAIQHSSVEDNDPYKLRYVSAIDQEEYMPVAIHHSKDKDERPSTEAILNALPMSGTRAQVISPSVYSRTTECRSTTPSNAMGEHGTFITVTGREVKRYSLDSPAKSRHDDDYVIKPSHEWKTWLNTELRDFSATPAPEDLSLTGQADFADLNRTPEARSDFSGHLRQPAERLNSGEVPSDSQDDVVQGSTISVIKTRRPQLGTRRSSIMNERYPLVGTGHMPSSDGSVKTGRRPAATSRQSSNTSRGIAASRGSFVEPSREKEFDLTAISTDLRPRVRERHSTAVLGGSRQRPKASIAVGEKGSEYRAGNKYKSTSDLRATYRNTYNLGNSSINIRCKPSSTIVQDDPTLRKISEGPYGQQTLSTPGPANKENSVPAPSSSLETGRPASSSRGTSRASTMFGVSGKSKDSPGQRMVDDWLNLKEGNRGVGVGAGSSPAFT